MQNNYLGDWRLIVFWAGIAVAAGIAGFTLGWLWRDRPAALSGVSLLSAMTAIGTLSAVFVALWAVLLDAKKRSIERRKSQRIYRRLFVADVVIVDTNLKELHELLGKYALASPGAKVDPQVRQYVERVASKLHAPALDKYIDALVHFEEPTAEALAAIAGNLPSLRANSIDVFENDSVERDRQAFAMSIRSRIEVVFEVMQNISWEVGAGQPPR